ncbi:MAG TPA: Trm112 family protein [Verrucomicrobiota bacterium]|nr:Trm112 family protein [Verrucomicrobiota bacterium]
MDEKLLEIMCCPETHQPLAKAGVELIDDLNQRIQAGTLVDRVDEKVTEPIDGGLIREDGKILFPIRQDIPVMLIDQGIPLGQ